MKEIIEKGDTMIQNRFTRQTILLCFLSFFTFSGDPAFAQREKQSDIKGVVKDA